MKVTTTRKAYTDKQREEILAYANASNVKEAATKFKVSEGIIHKWKKGNKTGLDISIDGDYVNIRIPKRQITRQLLRELI